MATIGSSLLHHHLSTTTHWKQQVLSSSIHAQQATIGTRPSSNKASRLAESLSTFLHPKTHHAPQKNLLYSDWDSLEHEATGTKILSPRENISQKWKQIHDSDNLNDVIEPLHPWLRREIIKYGEFAQATYDAFDFDSFSKYHGSCRYNRHKFFQKLGLGDMGYTATKYIYAMSHIDLPHWIERSHLLDKWSNDSNWMGYVAVSNDQESRRIGRRDIVVAWRGTVSPHEWYEDLQKKLDPIGNGDSKVEHGFLSIYTAKSESTRYNKTSASQQVMSEITRLVEFYRERGEEVSLTITGHSLGGALALLTAHDAATTLPPCVPISVISFGAPRVGNAAFRDDLHRMGVKTLRIVVEQDLVPQMPGLVLNEKLRSGLQWIYTHVGTELKLNTHLSPYLKHGGLNFAGFHSLETYLHLVDGFVSNRATFRSESRRDVALVNKCSDMLVEELMVPHCWGNMRLASEITRDPEDIPSPTREAQAHHHHVHGSQEIEPFLYA